LRGFYHLSRQPTHCGVLQATHKRAAYITATYLAFQPLRFSSQNITALCVSSYLAFSPLPRLAAWRYFFCGTVCHAKLPVAFPLFQKVGCSVLSGLSSANIFTAIERPAYHKGT